MKPLAVVALALSVIVPGLLLAPTAQAALDCNFGSVPFTFSTAEPSDGALDADTLAATPLFGVIPGLGAFEPEIKLVTYQLNCERASSGSISMRIENLNAPAVIGTTSYNGRTYDVYATNESWAGFILERRDMSGPVQNGHNVELTKTAGTETPTVGLELRLKYVKLTNPLTGTVGQLAIWLTTPQIRFDLVPPTAGPFLQTTEFNNLSVDILGVVCNLDAPAELDFGDTPIADLKVANRIPARTLDLAMNCGKGYDNWGPKIPDSMQVTFSGGTEAGLLDTDQENVKFSIRDRLDQAIPFGTSTAVGPLTNSGSLTATNTVRLSVKPVLKNLAGTVQAGDISGNLGIQVIYK